MATSKIESLLDLSTERTHPTIIIDEKLYNLAVVDDFGIREQHRIVAHSKQMSELQNKGEDISEKEAEILEGLFKDFVSLVVRDIPSAVVQALSINQCAEIVVVFTDAAGFLKVNPLPKTEEKKGKLTGEKSSPGSSVSTEGPPKDG
ncbi:MAG: hypothetical protein NOU37_09275 [Candidatus Brocadiales bacterium]|nr:hypothetical protein [Candidatus Bathyanammoxibius amoris]